MSSGIIGKILYFWVFIIGGLFFAKILGYADDDKSTIMICVAVAVIYIVFQVARSLGKKKRTEQQAADRPAVKKGQANKKKHKKR